MLQKKEGQHFLLPLQKFTTAVAVVAVAVVLLCCCATTARKGCIFY
jgi:hypothetical protein